MSAFLFPSLDEMLKEATPASELQVETEQFTKSRETATTEEAMTEPAAESSVETTENEDAHNCSQDRETYIVTRVGAELTHDESTISNCRCSRTASKRRSTSMPSSATKRRLSNDCVLSRMRSLRCVPRVTRPVRTVSFSMVS